jgi:hypothetical protein
MVYSRAKCVIILEHYFASKSSSAVREAFSNEYPDKEIPNKTTTHRLVTKFQMDGLMLVFEKVVDIFSIFCKTVL